jgi:hypothetical protein
MQLDEVLSEVARRFSQEVAAIEEALKSSFEDRSEAGDQASATADKPPTFDPPAGDRT